MSGTGKWRRREVLASGGAAAAVAMTLGRGARAAEGASAGMLPQHITDAQVHVWQAGGKQPSKSGRQEPLSVEELLDTMDGAGVERAVIVTPSWAAHGNDYALASAAAHPERLKVFGLMGMPKPEDRAVLEHWMEPEGMAGLRLFLSTPPGAEWMASGQGDWLWPVLEAQGIALMIHAGESIPELAKIAGDHPGLKIALDSFGLGLKAHGAAAVAAFDTVAGLAQFPNVMVKTEAVSFLSEDPAPYADMQTLLKKAVDAFGVERVIYASDITLLRTSYKENIDWWAELDFLSDEDRARIMGGNVNGWLDWPV